MVGRAYSQQIFYLNIRGRGVVSPGLTNYAVYYKNTDKYARVVYANQGNIKYAGDYFIVLTAVDSKGLNVSKAFVFKITEKLVIGSQDSDSDNPAVLPDGSVGTNYEYTITASGGTPPYKWKIAAFYIDGSTGYPPYGLTYPADNTVCDEFKLSGKPASPGKYSFKVIVTDSNYFETTGFFTVNITTTKITGEPVTLATIGKPYLCELEALGGVGNYSWEVNGLPDEITHSVSDNKLTLWGTPSAPGEYNITVKAKDSENLEDTKTFTLKVESKPEISGTLNTALWVRNIRTQ